MVYFLMIGSPQGLLLYYKARKKKYLTIMWDIFDSNKYRLFSLLYSPKGKFKMGGNLKEFNHRIIFLV